MTYAPVWLRGEEIYQWLGGVEKAQPLLKQAVRDHGIVVTGDANPARNYFRLPYRAAPSYRARRWTADTETIDWDTFSILAPSPSLRRLYQMTPIEASAKLLSALATIPSNRRYAGDDALVAEALEGIAAGKWAGAHAAAQALAPRAQGNSTEEAKVTRLGKKIRLRRKAASPNASKHLQTSPMK